jgi:hypothetical protein
MLLITCMTKGDFTGHEETTQTEKCNFSDDSPLFTFSNIIPAAAAAICRKGCSWAANACGQAVLSVNHSTNNSCQYTLLQLSRAGRRVGPVLCSLQPLCVRHLEYRATVPCRTILHGTELFVRKLCENADIVYGGAANSNFLFCIYGSEL